MTTETLSAAIAALEKKHPVFAFDITVLPVARVAIVAATSVDYPHVVHGARSYEYYDGEEGVEGLIRTGEMLVQAIAQPANEWWNAKVAPFDEWWRFSDNVVPLGHLEPCSAGRETANRHLLEA